MRVNVRRPKRGRERDEDIWGRARAASSGESRFRSSQSVGWFDGHTHSLMRRGLLSRRDVDAAVVVVHRLVTAAPLPGSRSSHHRDCSSPSTSSSSCHILALLLCTYKRVRRGTKKKKIDVGSRLLCRTVHTTIRRRPHPYHTRCVSLLRTDIALQRTRAEAAD